jgi:hypothetical protein
MGKGICTYRKRDLRVALEAAVMSGIGVGRIEIGKDGTIAIIAGKPEDAGPGDLDKWVAKHADDAKGH